MRKLFAILALFTLAACGKDDDANPSPTRGKLVNNNLAGLTYLTLDNKQVTLKSISTGKPMLVNYWATWCAPCVLELPSLIRLQETGMFDIITVSFDGDTARVKDFWAEKQLAPMTILFDRGGIKTSEQLGISGVPTTLILNSDLVVKGVEEGGREWDNAATQAKIYQALRGE